MGSNLSNNIQLENTFESALMAGNVSVVEENGNLLINGHIKAQRAASCLLVPETGDLVLYWLENTVQENGERQAWIISVLNSANTSAKEIALPNHQDLKINANNVIVNASDSINLNAVKEININVALGKLNECARSMYQMVQGSMIQLTKHLISKGEYLDFSAKKLLKSHAAQQLITAEKDVKIDGDRINMG